MAHIYNSPPTACLRFERKQVVQKKKKKSAPLSTSECAVISHSLPGLLLAEAEDPNEEYMVV